ncbi:MAG: HAD family hydrolase [Sedimentisphaerales bacterium]|jgi:HAD superfamily hydrolase (TIGR01509 family)
MRVKAVIFDLDGTITEPFFDFDAIRREMGLPPDAGPILELMEKMTPQQRADAERILLSHEEKAVAESTLNPGARETLDALRQRGIRIGILTRNKRDNVFAVADKHGLKFDAVVGREEGPVKPDAFGVEYLCRQFGVKPQETLVVGDYLFDLLCAKAAGAVSVLLLVSAKAQIKPKRQTRRRAVAGKNQIKADEFTKHADFVVGNIIEILQIIDGREFVC